MVFLLLHCFPTLTSKCPKGRFVALRFIYKYRFEGVIFIRRIFHDVQRFLKTVKMAILDKNYIFFLIFAKNIDFGYTLKPPR